MLKTIPLNDTDFAWVKTTEKDMRKKLAEYLTHKKQVYSEIKAILPEERTYLNTVYALEHCDDRFQSYFSKVGLLSEVSVKKEIRDAATLVLTELSEKSVDIEYDRDLYISLVEYYEGNWS
jgi:Zn-dependent oligopeptidase